MPTEAQVREALAAVYDPEIPVDILNLGLLYGVVIEDGIVRLTLTTTSPGCPVGEFLVQEIKRAVGAVPGVDGVAVELVWDPPWSPERMSPEARRTLGWERA